MPEGDTLFRIAVNLRKALAGKVISRFESPLPNVAAADGRMPVAGRLVQSVGALGKHLMIVLRRTDAPGEPIPVPDAFDLSLLERDLVLHTHLRMIGSWHIYRPRDKWLKPARLAHAVLHCPDYLAVCFNAPVVELLTAREATRHPQLSTRGPDAMTDDFDAAEALQLLKRRSDMPIGVAIMHQGSMAGVGNVFKSEVLFLTRLSPFAKVDQFGDADLGSVVAESHRLLMLNRTTRMRRTNFGLDQRAGLWVYGRSGKPCRVCGETVKVERQGVDGRTTYYCPTCQINPIVYPG